MIINLKTKEMNKKLTFGDVPINGLFVDCTHILFQKVNTTKAHIICSRDGSLFAASSDWKADKEIKEILNIDGFDY